MHLIITILPVVTKDLPISPRLTPCNFFIAMQVQHSYNEWQRRSLTRKVSNNCTAVSGVANLLLSGISKMYFVLNIFSVPKTAWHALQQQRRS